MLTRREFHLAVVAGASACFMGCNRGAPTDGSVSPDGTQVTLSLTRFPQLATAGGSVVVDVDGYFPLVVIRTADATATGVSATCTHASCLISYSASRQELECPCHHTRFGLDGAVLAGPAPVPLPVYTAAVSTDAITVSLA